MSEKIRGFGTMQIGGKTRPFHVNSTRQTRAYCELKSIELDAYWSDLAKLSSGGLLTNVSITLDFLYSALYAGAKRERLPIDFTYDDVVDWFEDADTAEADEFAKPLQVLAEMLQPQDAPKK